MIWTRLAMASAVALVAALVFYPALRLGHRTRALAWLICSAIVGFSPCLIPPSETPMRLIASLLSIGLLVKLYDLHREARLARHLSLGSYLAYIPNFFCLVLRRKPGRQPRIHDIRRLRARAPAALLSVRVCVPLFRMDWAGLPFALEHALKVLLVVSAVVLLGNALASVYRLLGDLAIDPMDHPLVAPTPGDFWRRWNRPAHQFLAEYAFKPAGGIRRPARATLVTFGVSGILHEYVFGIASGRVQGWQLLFFMLYGLAVVATRGIRPRGRMAIVWIAGTWGFNLASSVLFFKSVDQVVPFYSTPGP